MKAIAVLLLLALAGAQALPTGRRLKQVTQTPVAANQQPVAPTQPLEATTAQPTMPTEGAGAEVAGAPPAMERFGAPSAEEARIVPDWFTLWSIIRREANVNLGSFNYLLDVAGLGTQLDDPNAEFTVFAPTNDAFVAALATVPTDLETVVNNIESAVPILQYHIVRGRYTSDDLTDGMQLETLNPDHMLTVVKNDQGIFLNPEGGNMAQIIFSDTLASNGYIHVIDNVLLWPGAESMLAVAPGAEAIAAFVGAAPMAETAPMMPTAPTTPTTTTTAPTGAAGGTAAGTATGAQPATGAGVGAAPSGGGMMASGLGGSP